MPCYAVGVTASGVELRCVLRRCHRRVTDPCDHWDDAHGISWTVLPGSPWAVTTRHPAELLAVSH